MAINECSLVVNDVLEELSNENKRLLNELLFANKLFTKLKALIEFHSDLLKSELTSNEWLNLDKVYEEICIIVVNIGQSAEDIATNLVMTFSERSLAVNDVLKNNNRLLSQLSFAIKLFTKFMALIEFHSDCLKTVLNTKEWLNMRAINSEITKIVTNFNGRQSVQTRSQSPKVRVNRRKSKPQLKTNQTKRRYNLIANKISVKQTDSNQSLFCKIAGCDYQCENRCDLIGHMKTHPKGSQYQCKDCGKTLSTGDSLSRHKRLFHTATDRLLVCGLNECTKVFRSKALMNLHQKQHLADKKFVCYEPGCDYKCQQKSHLVVHMTKHSNQRPFVCPIDGCHQKFKLRTVLKRHQKFKHSSDSSDAYQCTYEGCGKVFKFENYLNRHIKDNHTNVVYRCEWPGCEYTVRRKNVLSVHMSSHCPKYTACDWPGCDKKFKSDSGMRLHMKCHRGDKRHACLWPGCDFKAVTEAILRVHTQRHTEPKARKPRRDRALRPVTNVCPECGKTFATYMSLYHHKLIHGPKRFRCPAPDCRYAAYLKHNVNIHVKRCRHLT